jgi:hypothetical protein
MSNPITPYHKNSSSNWEIEGGGRREKSKSLRPTRSIFCAIARSRSREEGSKCLALLYQKKEPYTS